MVDAWGMPHMFLILTADEQSSLRWNEIKDMEQLLKSFCKSFTLEDAPVESATKVLEDDTEHHQGLDQAAHQCLVYLTHHR